MEINIPEFSQVPPQQICQYLSNVSNHKKVQDKDHCLLLGWAVPAQ